MSTLKIFISYARKDSLWANVISEKLREKDFSVFFDQQALVGGEEFSDNIYRALERSDVVIVILSGETGRSQWVQKELEAALEKNKNIIPILIGPHATENWVWPLIADKKPLRARDDSEVLAIASKLQLQLKSIKNKRSTGKEIAISIFSIVTGIIATIGASRLAGETGGGPQAGMMITVYLASALFAGTISGAVAVRKRRHPGFWTTIAFLFPPTVLVLLLLPRRPAVGWEENPRR